MIRNLWSMKLAIVVTAMVIAPITHADVTVSGKYWDPWTWRTAVLGS